MNVPVRIFGSSRIVEQALKDKAILQALNVAHLPGVIERVAVMPDVHQGYGFPIGGVAATDISNGVISPGGIGYDINCGVRLLVSALNIEEVEPYLKKLINAIDQNCPSGVGRKGSIMLSQKELERVCRDGAAWAVKKGMGSQNDLRRTEHQGCFPGADAAYVSSRAKERGRPQLGTLGSGNHFLEIGVVEQVFDEKAAHAMGLFVGRVTMFIHSGSRGLGHQVCSDYVRSFQNVVNKYGINLPDRELVCAPLDSNEGKSYLAAMRCAANYAFTNRQIMAHKVRQAFETVLAGKVSNWHLQQVYDVTHNMGNIEKHYIGKKQIECCVHRKGATRAFGPGYTGLPDEYKPFGQPVLVPGSMGTASWVLLGKNEGLKKSFGSSCHGAGRVMSRKQATRQIQGGQLRQKLANQGIIIKAGSLRGLAEEAPQAYKDVDLVVESVCGAGLTSKVVRLLPLAVVKG
ncbi:MAG: RtcB family protein [Anaerolineaceae bacterium]|nr:RtcB family protein [Anaerolineaceae bacterium]